MKHVGIVGLGWHAARIHIPWVMGAEGARWTLGLDLESEQAAVLRRLQSRRPETLVFVGGSPTDPVDPAALQALEDRRRAGQLDLLLLCTDPLARLPFLTWALERGVDVVVDKPLTAPRSPASHSQVAATLLRDFQAVTDRLSRSEAQVHLLAQRRWHSGYRVVRDLLSETVRATGVPVTTLHIAHADGMWVHPDEWNRDHHPYRHRTGKLLHSGYHFVDLASWLLEVSDPRDSSMLDFHVRRVSALDQQSQLSGQKLLAIGAPSAGPEHGEVDLHLLGQVVADGVPRSTLSLSLLQNSVSRRQSGGRPSDPYKGAGRIRHESITAQVGPFLNIQVHSYQSHEIRDPDPQVTYGPGHLDHFDIHVTRNPLLPGPRHEVLQVGRTNPGHNEAARVALLDAVLLGVESSSELSTHARSNRLLAGIYDALDDPHLHGQLMWTP